MKLKTCRDCMRTRPAEHFTILRDGKWLEVAQCRDCNAEENRVHNRQERAAKKR